MNTAEEKVNIAAIPEINFLAIMERLSEKKKECESLIRIMEEWKNV